MKDNITEEQIKAKKEGYKQAMDDLNPVLEVCHDITNFLVCLVVNSSIGSAEKARLRDLLHRLGDVSKIAVLKIDENL